MSCPALPVNTLRCPMDRSRLQSLLWRVPAPALLALLATASPAAAGLILPEAGGGSKQAEDTQTCSPESRAC